MTVSDVTPDYVGYRVDSPDGRVGTVAAVLPPGGARRAPALLLRTNLLSCSLSTVSTEAIEQVDV